MSIVQRDGNTLRVLDKDDASFVEAVAAEYADKSSEYARECAQSVADQLVEHINALSAELAELRGIRARLAEVTIPIRDGAGELTRLEKYRV